MFHLPSEAATWLRRTGHERWVEQLPEHTQVILKRFGLQGIEVVTGGVSGLTLLARDETGTKVIVKTQPDSINKTVAAFRCLREDPFTPELIDADTELNSIVISYVEGEDADDEFVKIEELIPILNGWKAAHTRGLQALRIASETRLEHSRILAGVLEESFNRGELEPELANTFCDAKELLQIVEELYELFAVKADAESNFVHTDLGPHNFIRRKADDQIIVIDIAGMVGSMSYQIGAVSLLVELSNYMQAPDRVITLAEATETDAEASLFWAAFRGASSAVNLCGREGSYVDSIKMIAAAKECLRRANLTC